MSRDAGDVGYLEVVVSGAETATRAAPIIFVHGTGHCAWCWRNFAGYFAQCGYATSALDLRGHGASADQAQQRSASIADYVADVRRVAQSLEAPPILFGHSLGGLVVQRYLRRYPATAAVLIAPSPVNGMLAANWQIGLRHPLALLRCLLELDFAQFYSSPRLVHELLFLRTTPRAEVERYAGLIERESFRAACEMLLPWRDGRAFDCPVLVVGGTHDKIVPPRHVVKTAKAMGAALELLDPAAHDLILDRGWEAAAERIAQWLGARGCGDGPMQSAGARERGGSVQ